MHTPKNIKFIILFAVIFFGATGLLIWLLLTFAPYLLGLIALPAWLAAALADGAKI